MEILIKRLNDQAKLPAYSREAGPGIDLYALDAVTIAPAEKVQVATGIAMAVPVGFVALVWNQHSSVINEAVKVTTGMIDSGYRGEIVVELINTGQETKMIAAGEKIAQLLMQKVHHAHLIEAEDLSNTDPE